MKKYTLGKLKDIPDEIVEKMLDHQEDQGNTRSPLVFAINPCELKMNGGFSWNSSPERDGFWNDVIMLKKYDVFFKKYPKPSPYPKVMLVRHHNSMAWQRRVVFMEKNDHYLAWKYSQSLAASGYELETCAWKYAKDEEVEVELTLQEIADKFGISIDQLKIKK